MAVLSLKRPPGYWQRLLPGNEVNVRWFGARPIAEFPPDEVPDCTSNFQKATDYLLRHNGGGAADSRRSVDGPP